MYRKTYPIDSLSLTCFSPAQLADAGIPYVILGMPSPFPQPQGVHSLTQYDPRSL